MQRRRVQIEVGLFSMPRSAVLRVVVSRIIGLRVRVIVGSEGGMAFRVGSRCIGGGGRRTTVGGGGGGGAMGSLYICVILVETSVIL
jgi:hypothetical protein